MKNIIKIILSTILFTIPGIAHAKEITLFVHGTNPPGVDIKRKNFGGYIPKKIECSTALTENIHPHNVIRALTTGTHPFTTKQKLYFFGWDGFFPIQREQEAERLHAELIQFIKQNGITDSDPLHIQCLTHSHGGNVVLYLLNLIDKHNSPIVINEFILMGCPIFDNTTPYTDAQSVRKIFNLYSENDGIQIIDPQALYPESYQNGNMPCSLFARRTFDKEKDSLWQAEITVDRRGPEHLDWVDPSFLHSLAQVIDDLKTRDPGSICLNVDTTNKKPIEHVNLKIEK